ncbi:MAG: lipid-A-disaccharide synthase [Desulfobacteraceae bacterium]|nr:lipid-A-disaccharide synthase [Desulfobacteraceae bacterium]
MSNKCIMIIAGEASGDLHGANLVRAMHKKDNTLFFCGVGGQALRDAGVKVVVDASELSVVGITEVFSKIPGIFKGMGVVKKLLRTLAPDLLILIDFPDFNLHVAATAKRLGIPVLYYISPQIWAWRSGRVKKIGKLVDHMAVILPFEEKFYRKHKIPATFVGHPIVDCGLMTDDCGLMTDDCQSSISKSKIKDQKSQILSFLPGSREGEIKRHLPIMLKTAQLLNQWDNNIKFIISVAPSVEKKQIEDILTSHSSLLTSHSPHFSLLTGTDEVFEKSTLIVAASGTVTLQAGISAAPMIIIYKVSPVSYLVGKALIKVKNISLVNLIAGKEIVPELIQDEASPENIAEMAIKMLKNRECLERMRNELLVIRNKLGSPGASERVADIAMNMF